MGPRCRRLTYGAQVPETDIWDPGDGDWHMGPRCRRLTYGAQVPQADIRSPSAAGWHMGPRCRRLTYAAQVTRTGRWSPGTLESGTAVHSVMEITPWVENCRNTIRCFSTGDHSV